MLVAAPKHENIFMRKERLENSLKVFLRDVLVLWPYLFIAISIAGFSYIALTLRR